MTEREHIHQLYIIVGALAERIDALEQTRWVRFKRWVRARVHDPRGSTQ